MKVFAHTPPLEGGYLCQLHQAVQVHALQAPRIVLRLQLAHEPLVLQQKPSDATVVHTHRGRLHNENGTSGGHRTTKEHVHSSGRSSFILLG